MRKVLYILGQLTDQDVERLSQIGTRQKVDAGTILIEEGKPVDQISFLLDGSLLVTQESAGGKELAKLQAGEIVGEMSFVDASPPAATVMAVEDSLLLSIPRNLLSDEIQQNQGFAMRFYKAVAIFLADRLRGMLHHEYGEDRICPDEVLEEDELDPNVLGNLSLAGNRFDRMLKKLRGER